MSSKDFVKQKSKLLDKNDGSKVFNTQHTDFERDSEPFESEFLGDKESNKDKSNPSENGPNQNQQEVKKSEVASSRMFSKEDNKRALESRDMMTECDLLSVERLSPHKNAESIEMHEPKEHPIQSR